MELVFLSGPGVQVTPTAPDMRLWTIVGLVCAAMLLTDAVVTALLLRRRGSSLGWRVSVLLPTLLACVSLVYAWRTWMAASAFPSVPQFADITGDCTLCHTLDSYGVVGVLVAGASVLIVAGGVVYLLGKVV